MDVDITPGITHTVETSPGASQPQGLNSEAPHEVNTTSVYKQDSHVDLSADGDPEHWLQ